MPLDSTDAQVLWAPQPGPQHALVECPFAEVLFGGARGGGKTDGILGKYAIKSWRYGEAFNAVFFRKEMPQADDLIERAKEIYLPMGAEWREQPRAFRMPRGGRIRFRPLENIADAQKYQGQNLCVAVGTLIVMADGTRRPIESIVPGDTVITLEGPRRVLGTTKPYQAPCVEARVSNSSGELIGVQVHPVWHPVLTTAGISPGVAWATGPARAVPSSSVGQTSSRTPRTRRIWPRPHSEGAAGDVAFQEYQHSADRVHSAWSAWPANAQTDCKASLGGSQGSRRPATWSVPVALHAPTALSGQIQSRHCRAASIRSRVHGIFSRWCSEPYRAMRTKLTDQMRRFECVLPVPAPLAVDGHVPLYAPRYWQTVPGYRVRYSFDPCLYDERPRDASKIGQSGIRPRSDAAGWSRSAHADELDTTRIHSLNQEPSWVHPYTGEERRLSEAVCRGMMECRLIGDAWVTDLCVEGANHYISDTGLINKNSDAAVEEAGNYETSEPIDMLFGALRSKGAVPIQLILTANPGGPGQSWLRHRYIDPAPMGRVPLIRMLPNGAEHRYIYIPSRVQDNRILLNNDPTYINRLYLVGSDALVRAWLEGDWSVVTGAFFDCWSPARHVIRPFEIPAHWLRFGSFDWGSAKPFSMGWWAVSDGNALPDGRLYPAGAMIRYREWYGAGAPNVGLGLTTRAIAEGIRERERRETITYRIADPACWKVDGGPSHAEIMMAPDLGLTFRRADNSRVTGWTQVRDRLIGHDGVPMLYSFSTCPAFIRTLPALQHDAGKPEDVDSDGEDHAPDEARYACMSRPYTRKAVTPGVIRGTNAMTMGEAFRLAGEPRGGRRI